VATLLQGDTLNTPHRTTTHQENIMDQELAAAAAEDGLTLIEVTGVVTDEGTIVVLSGVDAVGREVTFAADWRMAQDIVTAIAEGEDVLTAVEPWAILYTAAEPFEGDEDATYERKAGK
jgi:hypothetical protein